MKILIDTREKTPLVFSPDIQIERCKLDCGDYQAVFEDGYTVPVIFERKGSLADLWNTLTADYSRFKEEVTRAKEANITLILIIEAPLMRILKGFNRSEVKGISILKTLFSLWCRYGVFPVFVKDRDEMAEFIYHYFWAEERKRKEKPLDKTV